MTASGIFINSVKNSSGNSYDGSWNLSKDVQGYYNVLYTHVDDTDVPICYEGVNSLVVIRTSNSVQTVIHFDDLSSDTTTDVETWLEAGLGDLLADIGVTINSATANSGGLTYTLDFDLSVTLKFSATGSTAKYLFGATDLTGTSITISGANINNRPKYLGLCITEATQIFAQAGTNNVNCLISSVDDLVKGTIVYIPTETSSLTIKLVRLNAPDVAVPFSGVWSVVLMKNFNAGFAS